LPIVLTETSEPLNRLLLEELTLLGDDEIRKKLI